MYILIVCATTATAQDNSPFIDSIKTSFGHKPKPDIRLDGRNSFIASRAARIMGVKVGVDFNQTIKLGLGYNWLASDFKSKRNYLGTDGQTHSADHQLRFSYISPYVEYTYWRTPRWESSIPVHLGFGNAHYNYTDYVGANRSTRKVFVLLYEPYMTVLYKVVPWFGVGGGVGYRLLFAGNRGMPENFNSPMYAVKAKLMLGELVKGISGKK